MTNFRVLILQEVNDVLWHTKIETGLDLIRAASLEDWTEHGQRAAFAGFLDGVGLRETSEAFSQGDQLSVIVLGAIEWD